MTEPAGLTVHSSIPDEAVLSSYGNGNGNGHNPGPPAGLVVVRTPAEPAAAPPSRHLDLSPLPLTERSESHPLWPLRTYE